MLKWCMLGMLLNEKQIKWLVKVVRWGKFAVRSSVRWVGHIAYGEQMFCFENIKKGKTFLGDLDLDGRKC
jgi:hypothetical protein